MLTFILVVVLGGGVGLLAVSLAESSQPATGAGENGRSDDAEPGPDPEPDPVAETEREQELEPEPELILAPAAAAESVAATDPPPAHEGDGPPHPGRAADRDDAAERASPREPVPRAFTAIEGRYADVARVPLWRRFLAVIGILAITVTAGVVVAAILGAAIGAMAEVLGNTIG